MGQRGKGMQAEVLDILRREGNPLSAYDVLANLKKQNPKIVPTTVYRALSVLMEQGRVHKLESMNTYVACQCDEHDHASILSICGDCGTVEENIAPDVLNNLSKTLGEKGFAANRHVIEIHGVCADCGTEEVSA